LANEYPMSTTSQHADRVLFSDTGGLNTRVGFTVNTSIYKYLVIGKYGVSDPQDLLSDVMIEIGDTQSSFEPYTKSNDLTISLGQTVYGGTLDVENGVLVVDKASVDLGDLTWNERSTMTSGIYRMLSSGISSSVKPCSDGSVANIVCSCYNKTSATATYAKVHGISIDNAGSISIYDERYNTIDSPSAFKTAMNGQTLVYELATPTTIQLTPHQINLLKGVNNISTDGNKITLTYRDGSVATLGDLTSAVDNLDSKIDESKILTDTVTGDKYILVVTNGVLSVEQISN
jgi:arginine repressor